MAGERGTKLQRELAEQAPSPLSVPKEMHNWIKQLHTEFFPNRLHETKRILTIAFAACTLVYLQQRQYHACENIRRH